MRTLLITILVSSVSIGFVPSSAPGATNEGRIINGGPADPGTYPSMTALEVTYPSGNFVVTARCGGTVIAPRWVLTAAHCTHGAQLDDSGLQTGTFPLSPGHFTTVRVGSTSFSSGGELLTVVEILRHPDYVHGDGFANDVALLRTAEASIAPPSLLARPGEEAVNTPPTEATVIGWGVTNDQDGAPGPESDELLEVVVPIVADDAPTCGQIYGQAFTAQTMLCAGTAQQDGNQGNSACAGDSGGPLLSEVLGPRLQVGMVSFGPSPQHPGCGRVADGVFTQVTSHYAWINDAVGGLPPRPGEQPPSVPIPPPPPPPSSCKTDPGATAPVGRLQEGDGNDPVAQAVAMSRAVYDDGAAAHGVLASSLDFADALGGSALAGDRGPLLYVDADMGLPAVTLTEFVRVVPPGKTIYVLGGEAVIGPGVARQLTNAGFAVVRLGGAERQQTARLVAAETAQQVADELDSAIGGTTAFDAVIVAFEGDWPDAVAAGQISAWFRIPVLLTPSDRLGGPAESYLRDHRPETVMVIGGDAVVGPRARADIEAITGPGSILRLFGPTRLHTGAAIGVHHADELFPRNGEVLDFGEDEPPAEPTAIVAVNLRRSDAFAHVLGASSIAGRSGVLFAPLEGTDGSYLDPVVVESVCGRNLPVIAAGGPDLVPDAVLRALAEASAGRAAT